MEASEDGAAVGGAPTQGASPLHPGTRGGGSCGKLSLGADAQRDLNEQLVFGQLYCQQLNPVFLIFFIITCSSLEP